MEPTKNAWPTMQEGKGDRRSEVRIPAPLHLNCAISGIGAEIRVRDISSGGLAVWAPAPLKPRSEHAVTLTFKDMTVTSRVRVAYCSEVDAGRWLVGMVLLESSVGATFDTLILHL